MENKKEIERITKVIENIKGLNDKDELIYFIEGYLYGDKTVKDLEDYISEYADGRVPVYNHDIIKEWGDTPDAHELTLEIVGEYEPKKSIIEMMMSDLYFWHEEQLREDYNTLMETLEEEE
jgi:hypothetical protein